MEGQPECFVSGALALILRLSRFFGVAPLRFERKGDGWRVRFCPRLAIFGHCLMTIYFLLYLGRNIYDQLLDNKDEEDDTAWNRIHHAVWTAEDVMVSLLACMTIYNAPAQLRCLIPCLNQIQKINSTLNIHHSSTQWTKKMIGLYILWGTVSVIATIGDFVVVIVFLSKAETLLKALNSLYYIHYWITHVRKMQYVLVLMNVHSGFLCVNNCLKDLLRETEQKQVILGSNIFHDLDYRRVKNHVSTKYDSTKISLGSPIKTSPHETVRRVALAYASTCDVVRKVDRSQGLIMLLLLASLFLHLIVTYYCCIINLIVHQETERTTLHILYELVFVMWSIVHTFSLVVIIEPCHLTHVEMRSTRVLVSLLMRRTHSPHDSLAIELNKFYKYLIFNEVSYSPLKIIVITRGLLLTILANVTTYLAVIMKIN